jgi:hypothetical protein
MEPLLTAFGIELGAGATIETSKKFAEALRKGAARRRDQSTVH